VPYFPTPGRAPFARISCGGEPLPPFRHPCAVARSASTGLSGITWASGNRFLYAATASSRLGSAGVEPARGDGGGAPAQVHGQVLGMVVDVPPPGLGEVLAGDDDQAVGRGHVLDRNRQRLPERRLVQSSSSSEAESARCAGGCRAARSIGFATWLRSLPPVVQLGKSGGSGQACLAVHAPGQDDGSGHHCGADDGRDGPVRAVGG
jgi:hypothetical protein